MRDFRDAKAMALTMRAALATRGLKITNSQSLELIAEVFGVADWNTLAAAIRAAAHTPRKQVSPPPTIKSAATPKISAELESTLQRALVCANQRRHEYATLEHLLLALTDDADASMAMKACKVDPGVLRENLAGYIDNELTKLVIEDGGESRPTPAFQRAVRGAEQYAEGLGRPEVTGAQLLVGIFAETRSPAVRLLGEHDMTRRDLVKFIAHGAIGGSEDAAP